MKKVAIVAVGALAAGALYFVGPSGATAGPRATAGPVRAVVDSDQPLRALAKRSNLLFGTAVDLNNLDADETYRNLAASDYSAVTAENAMKWESLEPTRGEYNWGPADQLVEFARKNGQTVHGHTLIWHNQLPVWLTEGLADGSITSEEFREIVRNHITTVVKHFRGKIRSWDVANEIFTDGEAPVLRDTVFLQHLGENYIADALRWAHAADPKAKLWLNDYATDGINPKSTAYYELAKQLLKKRAPLHGIGFQGHLDLQYPLPIDAPENLRRFDRLGLETAFTEVDVRFTLPVDNWKTAGQVGSFNTLLQACLLTPKCVMFTIWGFTDKYSWVPGWFEGQGSATPMDENFAPKPAYRGLQQVLAVAAGSPRGR